MNKILIIASVPKSIASFRGPLIKELSSKDLEIHIVAPFQYFDNKYKEDLTKLYGVNAIDINLTRSGISIIKDIIYFFDLIRVIKRINPNLVLAYTMKPIVFGLIAARLCRVKSINAMITGLGYLFIERKNILGKSIQFFGRTLLRIAISGCKTIIFQNPDDKNLFLESGLIRSQTKCGLVNGSGVDLQHYHATVMPKGTRFLMLSRLIKNKGVKEFAVAAGIVKKDYPDVSFVLAGELESSIDSIDENDLNLWTSKGWIEYLGEIEDVRQELIKCNVFCLPSYGEGLPRSVIEAMAMSKAIITTDVPGCKETVINMKNGILIPKQDISKLVDAMILLIKNPKLIEKMGSVSRQYAEDKFSSIDVAKQTANLIISS